jgi:anaerobic ribonucleoside-triphosphate reductase activating protein
MRFFDHSVTFREMPFNPSGSLTFFTGGQCKHECIGCSWGNVKPKGYEWSEEYFKNVLLRKGEHTNAVCILGEGDHSFEEVFRYLKIAKDLGFITMLYTGYELEDVPQDILSILDYIKVGKWEGKTLYEEGTNQRVYKLEKGKAVEEVKYYE